MGRQITGRFQTTLARTNKQLRSDRAQVIVRQAEKFYGRKVQDLSDDLENLQVNRNNLLDLNPGNTQTIINPADFKSEEFVTADIKLGLQIREVSIKLEVASSQYDELFQVVEVDDVPELVNMES